MQNGLDRKLGQSYAKVDQEPSSCTWNDLAQVYEDHEDYEKAIECFLKALELNANEEPFSINFEINLHRRLARVYEKVGHGDAASKEMATARRIIEDKEATIEEDAVQWRDIGSKWAGIDHDEAIRCYERATTLDPSMEDAWSYLAWLYSEKNDPINEKRCYEAAIVANWNSAHSRKEFIAIGLWHNLARVNDALGNTAEADRCRKKEMEMQELHERVLIEEHKGLTKELMAEQHEAETHRREEQRKELDYYRAMGEEVPDEKYRELDDAIRDPGLPEEERDALVALAEIVGLPMERFDAINSYTVGYVAKDGHVTGLALNRQPLISFPEAIVQLPLLKMLAMRECRIESLPEAIGRLTNLQELDLGMNNLVSLPDSFGELRLLEILHCADNRITQLPETIVDLISLRALWLSNNRLRSLPDAVGALVSLKSLDLKKNILTSLPENVGRLQALTYLMLDDNQLVALPDTIGGMTSLEALCIRNNRLETLPMTIMHLDRVTTIAMSGNPLTALPAKIATWIKVMEARNGIQFDAP